MRLGIALTLVMALPTVASAQYAFQLRPSPYRVLSGWQRGSSGRVQTIEHVTHAATRVSDHARANQVDMRNGDHDGDVTGGVNSAQAPDY